VVVAGTSVLGLAVVDGAGAALVSVVPPESLPQATSKVAATTGTTSALRAFDMLGHASDGPA
jgi:hypothetical protein